MRVIVLLCVLFLSAVGCDKKGSIDSTKERASAEQQAGKDVENKNQADKAGRMEAELSQRHKFYGALEGEYSGSLAVDNETYNIKLTFARSLPPYTGTRVRELSEIESDLNNLFLHMQVVQWHPADVGSAVGCRVSGIRPNMDEGAMIITSPDCPNLYSVLVSADGDHNDKFQKAKDVAQKLKDHQIEKVMQLVGSVQPSSNAGKYFFTATKSQ